MLLLGVALCLLAGGGIGLALARGGPERVTGAKGFLARTLGKDPSKGKDGSPVLGLPELLARKEVSFGMLGLGLLTLVPALRSGGRRKEPKAARRPSETGHDVSPPRSRRAIRRIRKEAAEIETQEGAEDAGHFLVSHGLREEAVEVFKRADQPVRAAEVLHDLNRFEEAAELYMKAGKPDLAASTYAQIKRFEEAAQCYLSSGKQSMAAEMYEKAENFSRAARCYREIGFHRNAAETYLKAGREAEAAESLIAVFNEEGAGAANQGGHRQEELRGVAKKAGQLLAGLGRVEEAERLLVRAGEYRDAATMAIAGKAFDRAAELYLRVGRGDLAADALKNGGDEKEAARVRGEWLRDRGDDATAAGLFEKSSQFGDAADLYRKLERFERAGECYARAGQHAAAAEMFRADGAFDRAAEAYERAGDPESAAECARRGGDQARSAELLEKAGKVFEAGKVFAEIDRADDAIRLLQQVDPDDERFGEAAALLGHQFQNKGMLSLAVKKLEQAVGEAPVSRQNIDANYDLARVLEESSDFARAAEAYERILTFDYHFKDVSERLEKAKRAIASGSESGGGEGQAAEGTEGRYRIERELGRGGMGVVYLARDTVLERDVAFKVLPKEIRESPTALRNFLREAKAAAKLNHPNIVTVYDAGKSDHGFYLAMEYVEGATLRTILERRGKIPASGAVYVMRQMADALSYAHKKKVVHRDIKTGNTMWTPGRTVKIMDFGLAKLLEEVRNATTLISGTPFYMSPEQTLGTEVDHRTDLYSLGVMIFELATGQVPFRSGNVPYHHVHTAPPDPREVNAQVPEFLAEIILRCLQKRPEDRFSSADEILAALDKS
jgi:tetratricopeptide (TPR) repeat protein